MLRHRVTCSIHIPRSASQTNRQSRPIKPMWNLKRGTWPVMTRLYPASKSALSTPKSGAWATGNARDILVEPNNASFPTSLSQDPEDKSLKARGWRQVCSIQGFKASRHSFSCSHAVLTGNLAGTWNFKTTELKKVPAKFTRFQCLVGLFKKGIIRENLDTQREFRGPLFWDVL